MKTPPMKFITPYLMIIVLLYSSLSPFVANQIYSSDLDIQNENSSETTLSHHVTPRASIIHETIFIDGDDPANDWDTFVNKTGSGTFNDPYHIENLEIDAGGIGSSIFIRDSDEYAEILNCTLSNSGNTWEDAGIRLINCSNIKLTNCTVEYNGYTGISIESGSNYNTLIGNNVSYNNWHGIMLYYSSDNILSGNNASYCPEGGIQLWSSNNTVLTENIASFSSAFGFRLDTSYNNTFSLNQADDNSHSGFFLYSSSNNTLSRNGANHNAVNGIILNLASDNKLFENIVYNNTANGITLQNSSSTTLFKNDASYGSGNGISLHSASYNNTLSQNNAGHNTYIGISLTSFSYNNTVSQNIVQNNGGEGFLLYETNNNSFSGNKADHNLYGVLLQFSNFSTFSGNIIRYNSQYGMKVDFSSGNTIYSNIFFENSIANAVSISGYVNSWDNGTRGNYWGDFLEKYPTATNDGTIWNTPYQIDVDNVDYFPLVSWYFSQTPIFIDGDDGGSDWDAFPKKTGLGTFASPYILEFLEIDAGGIGSGIFIRDSDAYAEIINCKMSNVGTSFGDAGIRVLNCSNIKIINCTSRYLVPTTLYIGLNPRFSRKYFFPPFPSL
jgi:parallel beta-helix repeat protein